MRRLYAMFWWIDRWRSSTAYGEMTLEEQGAYRNLLDEAHLRRGPIPNDERLLAKACGDPRLWRRVRIAVLAHFTLQPDGWHNETLERVLRESERRAENQRRYRLRHGRGPRHDNNADNGTDNGTDNDHSLKDSNNPDSPSPSLSQEEKRHARLRRAVSPGAWRRPGLAPLVQPWTCPHHVPCDNRELCQHKFVLGTEKYPLKSRTVAEA